MTPLEQLWNGWRATYVQSIGEPSDRDADDTSSVFTRILQSGLDDEDAHIVYRDNLTFAVMNAFPYSVGHVLVLPYRQVPDIEDLHPGEFAELWDTVAGAVRAVKIAMRPGGINVGINLGEPAGGSVREHLHVHVVPRWSGDANFMTVTANTRTLPEALPVTAAKLRVAWPERRSLITDV